jgi:hypothetical protein
MTPDSEFFPASEVAMDSPKLAWLKKHGIRSIEHDWTGTDFEGTHEPRWQAFIGDKNGMCADTEDEALAALCVEHGIKLWFEETA